MIRLITNKEMKLLENSEITKNHKILMELISEKEDLTIKKDDEEEEDDEAKIFFETLYPKIIKEAEEEWDINIERVEYFLEKKKCELCNRGTRNVCQIKNKYNGNTLLLGPSCINLFEVSKEINISKILMESKEEKILKKLDMN